MSSKTKIAIWGSYLWGNFGDDVMAVMISRHLQAESFCPVVYKLDSKLAEFYGIETEKDIKKLLSNTSACIVGGGGLLCSSNNAMDDEWESLYTGLLQYPVPVHFCSIGGDGEEVLPPLSFFALKTLLLPNIVSATVRLGSDVSLFDSINVPCEFYPDIILSAPVFFPIHSTEEKKQENQTTVIVNLGKSSTANIIAQIIYYLGKILGIKFIFLRTHLSWLNPKTPPYLNYEYINLKMQNLIYENIEQVRDIFCKSDLIVSSKLHVGVFAIAYGIPFLSIGGAKKTQAFLKQANLYKECYVHIRGLYKLRLLLLLLNRKKIKAIEELINLNPNINELKKMSFKHIESINMFLSKI